MLDFLGNWKRSMYCGEVRLSDLEKEVTLMGWVAKKRNLGALFFVDLRDREGICQLVFDEEVSKEAFEKIQGVSGESTVAIKGVVRERESKNMNIPTGEVEVFVKEVKILSIAQTPPIHTHDDDNAAELLRMQYRYLDLRKPKMQNYIRTRHKITSATREFLDGHGFIDIETPILTKPTPEGARDYLVPSRVNPEKFFALPQSPQIFKQLLMVSGFDKYYQIARCFRDEDLRADRQPEFTQIDIEMSFIEQDDIMNMVENMMRHVFKKVNDYDLPAKFDTMTYAQAMDKYGSDKPDRRFAMTIVNLSDLVTSCGFSVFEQAVAEGNVVKCIKVDQGADKFSSKGMKNLEKLSKTYGAKGLAWIKFTAQGVDSPIAKFVNDDFIHALKERTDAAAGDLILIVADKKNTTNVVLGGMRSEIAQKLELIDRDAYDVLWVIDFPLYEYDEELGRYFAKHHPFTSPNDEDIDFIESKPEEVRAKAYDLVINGYEVGGGSIRIFNQDLQRRMFKALGLSDEEVDEKFGFLVKALQYGTPPHGGVAFGLERLTMVLSKTENIKDVVAFPKTQNATCPLTSAPSFASDDQLNELHIAIAKKE